MIESLSAGIERSRGCSKPYGLVPPRAECPRQENPSAPADDLMARFKTSLVSYHMTGYVNRAGKKRAPAITSENMCPMVAPSDPNVLGSP